MSVLSFADILCTVSLKFYSCTLFFRGTYILPGGKATSRCIAPFEEEAIHKLPYIRDAFGSSYEYEEKRVVAPIRMGGIEKSYGEQCLIVGDAAGHVDPLTGLLLNALFFSLKNFADVAC